MATASNQTEKKPAKSLTFHERDHAVQAVKEDLLDVCSALGLKVSRSVAVITLRKVMRERLVELNVAGILPPDEPLQAASESASRYYLGVRPRVRP